MRWNKNGYEIAAMYALIFFCCVGDGGGDLCTAGSFGSSHAMYRPRFVVFGITLAAVILPIHSYCRHYCITLVSTTSSRWSAWLIALLVIVALWLGRNWQRIKSSAVLLAIPHVALATSAPSALQFRRRLLYDYFLVFHFR